MMQHSGECCLGSVVGGGWSPPWKTVPVKFCSRAKGDPLKVTPVATTRTRYTPSIAATVVASKRPGCGTAARGCISTPRLSRWSTGYITVTVPDMPAPPGPPWMTQW